MQQMTKQRPGEGVQSPDALPPIGCYVKDEFANEFQVRSGTTLRERKNGRHRFWLWLFVLLLFCGLGLWFGAWQQKQSELALWHEAQSFFQRAISVIQFPVREVHIVGHKKTKEKVIVRQIGNVWDRSLITLNTNAVQKKVEQLPWVRGAVVERVFPHTLNIYVTERQGIGRWVTLDGRYVFDKDGVVIEKIRVGAYLDLPIYEGHEAPSAAFELEAALKQFPGLNLFFDRYRWVDGRRWTLITRDGLEVLLPSRQFLQGLKRLKGLQARHKLLNRDLVLIDLRLEDRVTIRPKKGGVLKVLSTLEDLDAKSKMVTDSQVVKEEGF